MLQSNDDIPGDAELILRVKLASYPHCYDFSFLGKKTYPKICASAHRYLTIIFELNI